MKKNYNINFKNNLRIYKAKKLFNNFNKNIYSN